MVYNETTTIFYTKDPKMFYTPISSFVDHSDVIVNNTRMTRRQDPALEEETNRYYLWLLDHEER
jgi:hypothetical protein